MTTATAIATPSIFSVFVENLGAYNAGKMVGKWLDLPMDSDELAQEVNRIATFNPAYGDEVFIVDYNAPFRINEHAAIEEMNEFAQRLLDLDQDEEVIMAILEQYSTIEEGLEVLERNDYTLFTACYSMEDVAQEYVEEAGLLDSMPEGLRCYFDFESFGRDMEIDGNFIKYSDGYIALHN